jgi:hypothetical protein
MVVVPLLLAGAVVVSACAEGGGRVAAGGTAAPNPGANAASPTNLPASSAPPQSPDATGKGCNGTPVSSGEGFPEVRGTAKDAELWGLLFTKGPLPLPHGEEVKIVWRMTGEGPLQVKATLADGTRAKLAWGPEEHGGSSWRRPGQEWGTGLVFPEGGCWKVELTRTRGSGHVWLLVR